MFEAEGLEINVVLGIQYLCVYFRLQEDRDAWVRPQIEQWAVEVRSLVKVSKRHPWMAYAGMGMLLQLKWK